MPNKRRPTREQTDDRLSAERAKTDAQIDKSTERLEREAEGVVRTARERAANVLGEARRHADRDLGDEVSESRVRAVDERPRNDQALSEEYAVADAIAFRERQERRRLVASLLTEERAATDASLMLERADADAITGKRDEFLGMVSHDLRNELGAITLGVARLITNATNDESGHVFRAANNIQRITLRMSRLIGDLLDIASIEAGKFAIVPHERDVKRVVEELIESFQPIASAKDILLEGSTPTGPIMARFDQQRILQVLGNLLTNALKCTSPGGRITIHAERTADAQIMFTVEDTGVGIAADRLENIFERFSQGSGADRKGLGLGLYIARRIVEAHSGRLWAESKVGRGSTFRFTLPA